MGRDAGSAGLSQGHGGEQGGEGEVHGCEFGVYREEPAAVGADVEAGLEAVVMYVFWGESLRMDWIGWRDAMWRDGDGRGI